MFPNASIHRTLAALEGLISVFPLEVVLQLFLTGLSAIAGAAALLWLQSKSQRIKFLRALEDEIKVNLHTIQNAGHSIHEEEGEVNLGDLYFSTEVYKTIRVNDPILSSRFIQWMDPLYHSYHNLKEFNNRGPRQMDSITQEEALETLVELENQLVEAGYDLRKEQRANRYYRVYNRLSWNDDLSTDINRQFEIVPNGETWRESVDVEIKESGETDEIHRL